jgi:hypothetical protein
MAAYDILALIPNSPGAGQAVARVPGTGDTYSFPRIFGLSSGPGVAPDVLVNRDAANTLALRNGTAAQALNVYNTFTDASNYERGFARFSGNVFQIGTEAAGTGVARPVTASGDWTFSGVVRATGNGFSAVAGSNQTALWVNGIFLAATRMVRFSDADALGGIVDVAIGRPSSGLIEVNNGTLGTFRDLKLRSAIQVPPASLTFSNNGEWGVEMTSNTAGNLVYRGSDGTTRRCALTFV